MIEIFIEYWSTGDVVRHPWSIWVNGRQLASSHGKRDYGTAEESEADAVRFCSEILDNKPDQINRL